MLFRKDLDDGRIGAGVEVMIKESIPSARCPLLEIASKDILGCGISHIDSSDDFSFVQYPPPTPNSSTVAAICSSCSLHKN